jgi:hypothetical protein
MLFALPNRPSIAAATVSTDVSSSLVIASSDVRNYTGSGPMFQAYSDTNVDFSNAGFLWAQDGTVLSAFNLGNFSNTGTMVSASSTNQVQTLFFRARCPASTIPARSMHRPQRVQLMRRATTHRSPSPIRGLSLPIR